MVMASREVVEGGKVVEVHTGGVKEMYSSGEY